MSALHELRDAIRAATNDAGGSVLYRGESDNYPEVASTLRRACSDWRRANPDFDRLQAVLTGFAKRHDNPDARKPRPSEGHYVLWSGGYDPEKLSEEQVELMGELQHWGAATNLIDFTTDMDVAIYFACEEQWERDGRVIVIRDADYGAWRVEAKTPTHRARTQKSVFIKHPAGVVTPWRRIPVKAGDKLRLLEQLGELGNPVTTLTMYNDIHGYIRLNRRYIEGMDCYHEALALLDQYNRSRERGDSGGPEVIERTNALLRVAAERLYWMGGTWAEVARAHYSADECDKAIEMAEKAMRLGYRSASVHGMLATIALRRGDDEGAEHHAKKGLELCEQDSTRDQRTESRLAWIAMYAQMHLRRMVDAERNYRRALDGGEECPIDEAERDRLARLFGKSAGEEEPAGTG